MAQQRGVKRAQKVLKRAQKKRVAQQMTSLKKAEHGHSHDHGHDHDHDHDHDHEHKHK